MAFNDGIKTENKKITLKQPTFNGIFIRKFNLPNHAFLAFDVKEIVRSFSIAKSFIIICGKKSIIVLGLT